jgi:hypothetical protein
MTHIAIPEEEESPVLIPGDEHATRLLSAALVEVREGVELDHALRHAWEEQNRSFSVYKRAKQRLCAAAGVAHLYEVKADRAVGALTKAIGGAA